MGCYRKGGADLQATIHQCRIEYDFQQSPEPDAPCVLLLHGWGCDRSTFSFIQSTLGNEISMLSLDFPGHGQSDDPPYPWGVEDYEEQVLALLTLLSLTHVSVIAHSFGGRVALLLAGEHPELIDKLVITGGAGIKKPITESAKKRTAQFKRYNAALDTLKQIPLVRGLAEQMQTKLRNHYGSADYIKLNEVMRKTFVKVLSLDMFPQLAHIQSPTILIWGSDDTETPLWMGQMMEKEIPDAALIVFEGGSHFAFVEQWQRFSLIVKQFFVGGNT